MLQSSTSLAAQTTHLSSKVLFVKLQYCNSVILLLYVLHLSLKVCNVTNYPDFVYDEHCVILSVVLV